MLEEGMTVSTVVAGSRKGLSLQHSERGEYFHLNPPARVRDFIFNTNPQWPGEITGDRVTLTRDRKVYYKTTTNGGKDEYDSENSWISDGLPSNSRRRRRGGGRWEVGEWREK